MNDRSSFYDISSFYNKKAKLKASFKGMRYQVEPVDDEEKGKFLRVTVWPEPFSYEKTPEDYKEVYEFTYDEDGLDKAYEKVCSRYDEDIEKWTYAMKNPIDMAKKMGVIGGEDNGL